jgi:hypothetical protein
MITNVVCMVSTFGAYWVGSMPQYLVHVVNIYNMIASMDYYLIIECKDLHMPTGSSLLIVLKIIYVLTNF